ncbi:MAG: CmcJ/NvfI family oxidoreductase [Pseudomonadota bacterium]
MQTEIQYLARFDGPAVHYIYPRSSGGTTRRPPNEAVNVSLVDAREAFNHYDLDTHGFSFATNKNTMAERGMSYFFSNIDEIKSVYYADCAELVMDKTGASNVIAFDHNLRSRELADRDYANMNEPVRFCHNDYTHESGPKRLRALLGDNSDDAMVHRYAFINVWRPLMQPVVDKPLALCVAENIDAKDLVRTEIRHFKEEDLEVPAHIGEIYSIRSNPSHQWVYLSNMTIDEVIFIKCYDSAEDGRARFTPHTAVDLPNRATDTPLRESIEVRTVAFFD